jgi:hypothetical protein
MTLRDDVRKHFEGEAVRYPAPLGLRATALAEARGRAVERRSPQWIAGAVAILLAVAIVAGLLAASSLRHKNVAPIPANVPPKVSGPIPAGTPVVLYWRTVTADGLYAVSWSGALYKVPTVSLGGLAVQSPDGSRLAIGNTVYETRTGATTQLSFDATTTSVTWADDNRHVCLTRQLPGQGSPSEISYDLPGSPAVVLGRFGSQGQQLPGATVLACSATSNRVVVANVGYGNDTSDLWVLDTATGAVKYHRTYPTSTKTNGNVGAFVVASPDGQYLAETDAATGSATIRSISADFVVARLSGMEVHGFSWHGDFVLAAPRPPDYNLVNSSATDPVVIDWRTGKTVWHSPAGAYFVGRLAAQPDGKAIAFDLRVGQNTGIWLAAPTGLGRAVDPDIQFLVTVLIGLV